MHETSDPRADLKSDEPILSVFDCPYLRPCGNLGDLLGPVILAAMCGRRVRRGSFQSMRRRLVTIGTIAQRLSLGTSDLWGTGVAGLSHPFELSNGFRRRRFTRLVPHALRGPFSAALLREAGYGEPLGFGDPAMLLPLIWPRPAGQATYELGVIPHISEFIASTTDSRLDQEFRRYDISEQQRSSIRIINPWTDKSARAIRARIEEIWSCKRILSTSLHGMVIAEAYGMPAAHFDFHAGHSGYVQIETKAALDHRVRDFWAGMGHDSALVYRTERHLRTDWDRAMRFLDSEWSPRTLCTESLIASFPENYGRLSTNNFPASLDDLESRLNW